MKQSRFGHALLRPVFLVTVWIVLSISACSRGESGTGVAVVQALSIAGADTSGNIRVAPVVIGMPFRLQLLASGGTGEYVWRVDTLTLPNGITITPTGAVTGALEQPGVFTVSGVVISGNIQKRFVLHFTVINPALSLRPVLPAVLSTIPYHEHVGTSEASPTANYRVANGQLPPGLTLAPNGVLHGVTQATGWYSVSIESQDGTLYTTRAYRLLVTHAPAHKLAAGVINISDPRIQTAEDRAAAHTFLISVPQTSVAPRLLISASPDYPSDSLSGYPPKMPGGGSLVRLRVAEATAATTAPNQAALVAPQIQWKQREPHRISPPTSVPTQRNFCGGGWGLPCPTGLLTHTDSLVAYYEEMGLPEAMKASPEFWQIVSAYNRTTDSLLTKIWGLAGDVDGDRRISVFLSRKMGNGWMWNDCIGPGPVQPSDDCRASLFERMNTKPWGSYIAEFGPRIAAARFVFTQATDQQEVTLFSNLGRYPGTTVEGGQWYNPVERANVGSDRVFGNGFSFLVPLIWTDGAGTLPDGTRINLAPGGGRYSETFERSCLSRIDTCTVNQDTYGTPSVFAYWLWQLVGDGIGHRYADALAESYSDDFWNRMIGVRGGFLFNWFFLSSVLDGSVGDEQTFLRWPRTNLRHRVPTIQLPLKLHVNEEVVLSPEYSGAKIVELSGVTPGHQYLVEVTYLSRNRSAVTTVFMP